MIAMIDSKENTLNVYSNILQSIFFFGGKDPNHAYAIPLQMRELPDGRMQVVSPAAFLDSVHREWNLSFKDNMRYVFVGKEQTYMGAPALCFSLEHYMAYIPNRHGEDEPPADQKKIGVDRYNNHYKR